MALFTKKILKILGDPSERVQWRSKQNLDYAFLMMYAQWRGTFYVQLEDDILTKPYFVATMRDFALEKNAAHEPWFVIDFCQLGTSSSHVFTNFVITNLRFFKKLCICLFLLKVS